MRFVRFVRFVASVASVRRPLGALGALALAGLALGACGIPTQQSASPISARQLQTRLPVTRPTVNPCTKSACTPVDVFFVGPDGRITPVGRVAPPHPKIGTVIDALLGGPTPPERAKGIFTALGAGIHLLSSQQTAQKKTVSLDFSADFGILSGAQEVLGVAQVVYTVASIRPGFGVIFEIDGVHIEVPVETGALSTGPVHESQYDTLLTTTAPTTTTTP